MNLRTDHYHELVSLALNDKAGWIYAGPLESAKRHKLHSYDRANRIADLITGGLVSGELGKSRETVTLRLTSEGKAAILAMPDDLHADFFPLPHDIALAKERVKSPDLKLTDAQELSALLTDRLRRASDVFWAVRELDGRLVKGYWYRIFRDERREEWIKFDFLGANRSAARRAINRMSKEDLE
jgi:hypothetical protein